MKYISKEILLNTVKISAAAILATGIAIALELNYALSTGAVAILTILPTKRETVKTAAGRLLAFLSALGIAFGCYRVLGFHFRGYAAFLLLYILVCQIVGWYSSMAINSVLMSHFLSAGTMTFSGVVNEASIFLIGMSIGVIANMHLRKNADYIEELKEDTDNQIKKILHHMSQRILNNEVSAYNEDSFRILIESIDKAKYVAYTNYNNQLRVRDREDIEYIHMRERQCEILYEMYKNIRQIHTTPFTAGKISAFLEEMSSAYHKENTGIALMEQFRKMDKSMKGKPLPTDRAEFEDRARLFYLLRQIEEFIQVKVDFLKQETMSLR